MVLRGYQGIWRSGAVKEYVGVEWFVEAAGEEVFVQIVFGRNGDYMGVGGSC